jgi:hypothetical protein
MDLPLSRCGGGWWRFHSGESLPLDAVLISPEYLKNTSDIV